MEIIRENKIRLLLQFDLSNIIMYQVHYTEINDVWIDQDISWEGDIVC